MKLLILEDEYNQVLKGAFDYLNVKFCNNSLEITNLSKTQDLDNIEQAKLFDKIFVDISLHRNSTQDGYAFIKSLKDANIDLQKVIIITGSDKVEEKLKEFELPRMKILTKPTTFLDLKEVLNV